MRRREKIRIERERVGLVRLVPVHRTLDPADDPPVVVGDEEADVEVRSIANELIRESRYSRFVRKHLPCGKAFVKRASRP